MPRAQKVQGCNEDASDGCGHPRVTVREDNRRWDAKRLQQALEYPCKRLFGLGGNEGGSKDLCRATGSNSCEAAQLQLVRVGAVLGVKYEHIASAASGINFHRTVHDKEGILKAPISIQ
jgi:hypothetical protein